MSRSVEFPLTIYDLVNRKLRFGTRGTRGTRSIVVITIMTYHI